MSNNSPRFSIIICLYVVTERFFSDLAKFLLLNTDPTEYELILVTEKGQKLPTLPLPFRQVEATIQPISLGEKRDLGIAVAKGEFCALIDDDAYPHPDWLEAAAKIFDSDPQIAAVGGPNLTAPDDPWPALVGGYIYESYLTSGAAQYRFLSRPRRQVAELQGVNLIIRTSVLRQLGGFRSRLSSGDDTKVCRDIRALGYQVIYDPAVQVWHHRRPFAVAHLKQIRNMGRHRGFFVKAYPETLAPIYFLPTLFALCLLAGLFIAFIWLPSLIITLAVLLIGYLIAVLANIFRIGWRAALIVGWGILLTHLVYGLAFVHGLFLKRIERP
ncbi:MAG: glycosyltransferase [Candidatus Berkelbacteria bacterium Gr01-1014_85]|uniref:Glycosyltransferase n=1 Tax=Candidatus Berkelbacteria bacterium Gr01-1014_85 TaxID=2017150 RepID=A0A554JC30_9BACT|nr:MAG: glycosyltransferase [Candidatus Berkelbacteria bacterium Gr01-1014_85]